MSGSDPGAFCSLPVSSMSMPSKLRNVSGSVMAARTSSNLVRAYQPHRSLWYTGASSRIHRYTETGSDV